jgi:hypothetical protein
MTLNTSERHVIVPFLVGVVVTFLLVLALGLATPAPVRSNALHCPTEDSCYPDYHNGQWTIYPGQRSQK